MAFVIHNPPEFTLDVEQWTRQTKANGEQMAKNVIEPMLNNDNYLNIHKADVNHTHDDMAAATVDKNGKAGLVPAPDAGNADRYLRSDGTWHKPPNDNTTYGNMSGASANTAGKAGLVPAPAKGNADRYLRSDGTWQKPPNDNTTYGNMTAASASAAGKAGLVPAPAAGAQGKYLRGDGTWQTPPDTNTTYSVATQSANGLMSAADKKKLDGVATKANVTPSGLMSGYVRTGQKAGTTIGAGATAEGNDNTALGIYSHTEGRLSRADEFAGHAEGYNTRACGTECHAEGYETMAVRNYSHAGGVGTQAYRYGQYAIGEYNYIDSSSYLVIGNGASDESRSNAFRVAASGAVYGKGAFNTSGADYAEYFEWLDRNPKGKDRRGYFVTLDRDKIRIANSDDDYVLGIISGKPSVIGNSDPDNWHGHFLCDEFGEFNMKKILIKRKIHHIEETEETYLDEDGIEKVRLVPNIVEDEIEEEVDSYVLNPDYDPDRPYTPRSERKEWAAVGMLGVLLVRDDGTCQVNSYCKVADGGIATAAETGWRVIARVNEWLVKIVFR